MPTVVHVTAAKPKKGGAVWRAPLGTALPTDTTTDLDTAFKDLGFCGADGLTNANSPSSKSIKDWNGDTVLDVTEERSDTFKFKLIESLNPEVLKVPYGDSNVTGTLNTGITVKVGNDPQGDYCWVFEMVTRNSVKRIVVPNACVTTVGEIVYNATKEVGYEVTVSAKPDSTGFTHYEYIKKKE